MSADSTHILVIDDEIGMREGCRRALASRGFQVTTAEHGVDGLRHLREGQFDLVLLDAMMPGLSGLELLERIQAHDPDVVCIMITGYATVDLAAQAMKKGAHDFLPKPFTSDELVAAVQRGLEERRRRLARKSQQEAEEESQQLERTRQEIAKLDAIESRFLLTIAHKLRDPAGVIKNYVQLMRAGYVEEDEWDEYLDKLGARAEQLLNMLDDLLELAHLKGIAGRGKLQPVDVADVLEEVVKELQPKIEGKGLDVEVRIEARPRLSAQRAHLRSLWSHLLENAIAYTPAGTIETTLSQKDDQAVLAVADTGIGISTEALTQIFQEFYRGEAAREEMALGTGLGLPIVEQLVQTYHGTIQVDSAPGRGSTFTVQLPLSAPPSTLSA